MKIVLCGSMSFHKEMADIAGRLLDRGHSTKIPELPIKSTRASEPKISIRAFIESNGGIEAFPREHPIWEEKSEAIDHHFEKVAWSDAILVVNYPKHDIEGYIGGNTLMEMALARHLGKKVFVLFQSSYKLPYQEEILGIQPFFIDGDLSKLSG